MITSQKALLAVNVITTKRIFMNDKPSQLKWYVQLIGVNREKAYIRFLYLISMIVLSFDGNVEIFSYWLINQFILDLTLQILRPKQCHVLRVKMPR